MPISRFLKSFREFVQNEAPFTPKERVVVGCSGGPDSVAMLRLLVELNHSDELELKIHVAHLNHVLRGPESDGDELFVTQLTSQLGLPVTVERKDIAASLGESEGGIEETARLERFRFFQRVAYQTDSQKVLLAHHADDNAETILFRIVRGTGLRGLAGIRVRRELFENTGIELIRPILCFTRAEILEYLELIHQPYRVDSSNVSPDHTRNRLRTQIFPLLRAINPRVSEAILRLGEQASLASAYLFDTARRTLETLILDKRPNLLSINHKGLVKKSLPVQAEVIRQAILTFGLGEQEIGHDHIFSVLKLVSHPGTGRRLDLPGGLHVSLEYHHLVFMVPDEVQDEPPVTETILNIPDEITVPEFSLRLRCLLRAGDIESLAVFRQRKTKMEEWLDFSRINPPLVVRNRKASDKFWPLGAPGSKKLTDFLADCRIESWQRDRLPIVADQLGPLWVVGHRIDERVRVTRTTTQVLHLSAENLGGKDE